MVTKFFQLLMLSPNLLKYQIPYMVGGGGGDELFPTFDAESKPAKIPNSLYGWGGEVKRHQLSVLTSCESLGFTT